MRARLLLAVLVLSQLGPARARADHVKDPAELLPANTIVYGELRQPGRFAKEVASLFEGSPWRTFPTRWRSCSRAANARGTSRVWGRPAWPSPRR